MLNILFTICGRAGSKGIKNKNLRIFCGKPLVYFSISVIDLYLQKHPEVNADCVVNSDSMELIELVERNQRIHFEEIIREESLSGDSVGKIDVSLEKMQKRTGQHYNIVVDLDITSPLRTVRDLEDVIEIHTEKAADVTTTAAPARRNPYFNQVKKVERGYKKVIDSNYTARQQAPRIFDLNASIYAYNPNYLNSGKGVLDGYCEIVEMADTGVLDLDHESDFELMEVIAAHLLNRNAGFREVFENIP